jgi:hypothetical protein
MASRSLLPKLGGEFFHTGYSHVGCDNELTARCMKMGKYAWAEEVLVEHRHPALDPTLWDDVYREAWRPDRVAADRALLATRSKELGFKVI